MNVGGKSKERFWLLGLIATLALVVGGPAYAQQGIMQNLEDSFELHGYVENQEIIRSRELRKTITTWRRFATASTCNPRAR